jgi:hypothetical protein
VKDCVAKKFYGKQELLIPYVGFGMLTPVYIMALDRFPKKNTGAIVHEVSEFIYDDAAIIACVLRQWGVPTGMIGTAVGDDLLGHEVARQLKKHGRAGRGALYEGLPNASRGQCFG